MENKKRIPLMSIITFYSKQIFEGTKAFEFRKSPLKDELLNQKIYIYSAKDEKAIIGYFRVSEVLKGNTAEILSMTGYDKRADGHEIESYFGCDNPKCCALKIYDVNEFTEYLSLKDIKSVANNIYMPQYLKYIYEGEPLYDMLNEWDETFSKTCSNPELEKERILSKYKKRDE